MDLIIIMLICVLSLIMVLLIHLLLKEAYMFLQWRKLMIEVKNSQNLSGHELLFELDYFLEEEKRLYKLQNQTFPYLKVLK